MWRGVSRRYALWTRCWLGGLLVSETALRVVLSPTPAASIQKSYLYSRDVHLEKSSLMRVCTQGLTSLNCSSRVPRLAHRCEWFPCL
jgi:hypothetical protein